MALKDSVNKAKEFVGQMEEELLSLVEIYKVGNPRKEGILYKIAQAKSALDEIQEPEPPIISKKEPAVEKRPSSIYQKRK